MTTRTDPSDLENQPSVSLSPCLPVSLSFLQLRSAVMENVRLARNTYRIRLHAPALAARIRPGQFLMLRLPCAPPIRCWAGHSRCTTQR